MSRFGLREKELEKILTLGLAFRSAFHQPLQDQRSALLKPRPGDSGPRSDKKNHKRRVLTRPEKRPNLRSNVAFPCEGRPMRLLLVQSRAVTAIASSRSEGRTMSRFSARNAVRPVLQARPGGIHPEIASAERRVKPPARLLRCATALRVTAPPGCGSRRLVWPKGSLSARQARPENPPRGVLLGASPSMAIERYQMRYKITG